MRVLHIIPSMNPAGGGPVEGLSQACGVFNELGHTADIACLDDPAATWIVKSNLSVHALGPPNLRMWRNYYFSPRLIPWLRSHVNQYDAVIIHGIWQYHSLAARRVSLSCGVPYFVYTHGMLGPWFKHAHPLKHLKKWLYWPFGDYRVLRDATAVMFTCEQERVLARQSFWLYRCNEFVADFGTMRPSAEAGVQREAFLGLYPALRGKKFLLFLGRIHPVKGCNLLIEAFARAVKQDESLHLVIAGPDQVGHQQTLVKLSERLGVDHRITWPGILSGDVKWGAYRSAEAFVLPSHHENFGVVVAEALACRLPVLITNKVNIWQEIRDDQAGIAADDTLEGISELLQTWLRLSDHEKDSMRQKALESFDRHFEIGKVTKRFETFLTAHISVGQCVNRQQQA